MRQRIDVGGNHPYPLFLGNPIEEVGDYLEERYGSKGHFLIITNTLVADLYAGKLMSGLNQFRTELITVPDGEQEKSLQRISTLTEQALRCRADRDTIVIGLGGGVIGDLSGFFASIFMRGVRYLHIPTTLLAQIDSSIGGKVAVNHPSGKNLLGAFYPPQAVWTDFKTLETLPWEEIQNGLAETIKHAMVADIELFDFIEEHAEEIKQMDDKIIKEMAMRSLAVKVRVVTEDEKEKGQRILLNLGHSFGHALETDEAYKGVSHGQGVSLGLVASANLAHSRGLMTEKQLLRVIKLLTKLALPTTIENRKPEMLLRHMSADKKNKAGNKILILPIGLGKAAIATDCEDEEIVKAWEKIMK